MAKRLFDLACAVVALIVLAPVMTLAALGIRLSSAGPVLYRARRAGLGGRPFTMYKLRTMHVATSWAAAGGSITAQNDPRVFPFGRLLRRAKIDELPQLFNVVRGDMSIVGPRPEELPIVERYYSPVHYLTLRVPPGLASPGSLYQYTHGDRLLGDADLEARYATRILPVKLALELIYVRRASLRYDVEIIARTLWVIAAILAGRRIFPPPRELREAAALLHPPPRPLGWPLGTRRAGAAVVTCMAITSALSCAREPSPPVVRPPDTTVAYLAGAGDIAVCSQNDDEATAALLDSLPGTVFTAGDNVYPDGTALQFATCYDASWGRHRDRTRPAPGNHDYNTTGASGYFGYFGAAAGDPARGYYSFDLGGWHVIALNSEIAIGDSSAQLAWLRQDLAAHPVACTVAYWHHPRFSSGTTHGSSTVLRPAWEALYSAGADVVISGHEHHYERFAPQTPAGSADSLYGLRAFVVGTGGASGYAFGTPIANSEVRHTGTPGVLQLTLRVAGYDWRFVPVAGETFTDAGSGQCHDAPPAAAAARQ